MEEKRAPKRCVSLSDGVCLLISWNSFSAVSSMLAQFCRRLFALLPYEGRVNADSETGPSFGLQLIKVFPHCRRHGFHLQRVDRRGLIGLDYHP